MVEMIHHGSDNKLYGFDDKYLEICYHDQCNPYYLCS